MAIEPEEVARIARLAHLELPVGTEGPPLLDEPRRAVLGDEIERILAHVRELEQLDVTDVPPTAHGVPLPTRVRPDEPSQTLDRDRALEGAPAATDGGFRVPKVVE